MKKINSKTSMNLVGLGLSLLAAGAAAAQSESDAPSASVAPTCDSEQHRQFDFWLGRWEVTANGQPAGRNHIEKINNGCALAEHWISATPGFSGSSLNIYDRARGEWHQTWVDSSGTLLQIDGGWADGKMVLSGTLPGPDGRPQINRITWTPNKDGSVRQHWETSSDGQAWSTAFDGHYVRAGANE